MIWAAGQGRMVLTCAKCASTSIRDAYNSIGRTPLDRKDKGQLHRLYSRSREINIVVRSPEERLFSAYQMFFVHPAKDLLRGQTVHSQFAVRRSYLLKNAERIIHDPLWGFADFCENHFHSLYDDAHFAPQWSLYGYPVVMFGDRVRLWRMDQLTELGEHLGIEIPHENRQRWLWTNTDLYSVLSAVYDKQEYYQEDHWLWARANT